MSAKGYRGYVTSRPFMGERAPQHIQNIVIRDYCKKNNLLFLLSATEYVMDGAEGVWRHVVSIPAVG